MGLLLLEQTFSVKKILENLTKIPVYLKNLLNQLKIHYSEPSLTHLLHYFQELQISSPQSTILHHLSQLYLSLVPRLYQPIFLVRINNPRACLTNHQQKKCSKRNKRIQRLCLVVSLVHHKK